MAVVLSITTTVPVPILVQVLHPVLTVSGLTEEEEAAGIQIQLVEEEGCRIAGDRGQITIFDDNIPVGLNVVALT